jgi:hypothetical protein
VHDAASAMCELESKVQGVASPLCLAKNWGGAAPERGSDLLPSTAD